MFIKNLQFAFRNFKKHKATTAINILGLAVGISASIVIFLIVRYDYSFDKWEPQRENIYRIVSQYNGGINPGISLLAPEAIEKKIPGIQTLAHSAEADFDYASVGTGDKRKVMNKWGSTIFADENYFKIFPHRWLAGNPQVLTNLNTIVLSRSEAQKFFGNRDLNQIIGKTITFNDSISLVVSGIVADLKTNTDFDYKNFISLKTFMKTSLINSFGTVGWGSTSSGSQCIVVLDKHQNIAAINTQLKKLFADNMKRKTDDKDLQFGKLQALKDIHFDTDVDGSVSKSSLFNLGVLALLLLLLAAINFINLSTAQSTLRAKEIGVRKTFGGNNKQIIYQFLTETFLITLFATLLALTLTPLLLYAFKGFIPEGLSIKEIFNPLIVLFLAIMIATVTVLAGLYPSFVLTKFKPVAVLKNQVVNKGKSRSAWIRQVLTVTQFVVAQVFLIMVFVIGKQIHYMLNKDLGFRKDAVISFYIPDGYTAKKHSNKFVLMNDLKQISGIQNISISSATPVTSGTHTTDVDWRHNGLKTEIDFVHTRTIDDNYLNLFNLKLVAGRNIHTDTSAKIADVLVNETLMRQMGYQNPDDVIGQYFSGGSSDSSMIVGVVKDFTTQSLHNAIRPVAMWADNASWGYIMSVLLNPRRPDSWKATINAVEKKFKIYYPNIDFDYSFYDNAIKKMYDTDIRLSSLLKWATGLAIFISCLGLLGLVSFMANQRTKEIGIRKVLGASVSQIITLLSKSLVKLVVIASVVAFPIAWYFSHKWLQDFAFKTILSWWIFIISGIGMLLIALTVLCLRTFKAARANPVESLKDE